jgi:putative adhesin/SHOCT-like protein
MTRTGTPTGAQLEHRIGPEGLFSIALGSGEARLRGVGGDRVRVRARRGRDLADLFTIGLGDGSLSLRDSRETGRGRGGSADVEIDLPFEATVVVEQSSGDLEADGLTGDQRYRTASGDVRLGAVSGRISVESASGDVDIVAVGAADVTLRTMSGDVELRAGILRSLQLATTSGDLKVAGRLAGPGPFSIVTVSGDALLAPAGDVRIEMATLSGDLHSELGGRVENGRGRRTLTIGSSGPTVEFRSMSGDVTVTRPKAYDASATASDDPETAAFEDEDPGQDASRAAETQPEAPTPETATDHPATNGAIEAAYDEARLRILRSLERGEIDVAEAGRRLEALDGGPDEPAADADADTARFDPAAGSPGA